MAGPFSRTIGTLSRTYPSWQTLLIIEVEKTILRIIVYTLVIPIILFYGKYKGNTRQKD